MNKALWKMNLKRPKRGGVPTWTGNGWQPLEYAGASVTNSVGQTLRNNVVQELDYDTKRWDTHGFFTYDTAGTPSINKRLTIPKNMGGIYHFGAEFEMSTDAAALSDRVYIALNLYAEGTTVSTGELAGYEIGAIQQQSASIQVSTYWLLKAGDFVTVTGYQSHVSVLKATVVASNRSPNFWIYRVGILS